MRAAWARDAARHADLAVVSVPLTALDTLPADDLAGKPVIDTGNYYPARDGRISVLDAETTTTSELLQAKLVGAHVVKVLSNLNYLHMQYLARPHDSPERTVLPLAADSDTPAAVAAKRTVIEFIDSIGFDILDVGPLSEGWRFQRDEPAYVRPYDGDDLAYWPPRSGRQVTEEELRRLLAAARRYRD